NYNLMNTQDYSNFLQQARRDYLSGGFSDLTAAQKRIDTKWLDVFFQDAISQTHTLTFSAGSKNLSAYTSVGYAEYEGILKTTGLKRMNFRSNLNGKSNNERLTFGTNVSGNYSISDLVSGTGTNRVYNNLFLGAFQ